MSPHKGDKKNKKHDSMGLALKVGTFFQKLLYLGEALVEAGL